ncbi:fumarylacetoacetate hydrolase family protein [Variovorax sp. WS11]|uniref:fumarylacetoacetate hydrolase family protein n=1 Tax=Variovorax sp. WS11 TaxID=1105204 RepID=UPI0013DC25D3|nr:fumarylacetoacetate hydrolase family protein [Variovorax sp. WS11]NDZ17008.1 fumarylacetoacetate hydrolase family protein [Variovorax sp. WS11]
MKLASFDDFRIGVVDGDVVYDITPLLPAALDLLPRQRMNWLLGNWDSMSARVAGYRAAAQATPWSATRLLAPNPAPPHIFAAPANYRKHLGELGSRTVTKPGRTAREQGFFLKAPGSLVGAGEAILVPQASSRRFDHESELAVIIGRGGRNIPRANAMEHVFGYTCLIDATMRIEKDVAEEERSMRKSFEGFTPMGPWIVTADEVPDPGQLRNRLWVNGELRQEANTAEMIVGVAELIELVSSVLWLQPGDVIASGTPEGVGPFRAGDELRIEIDSVGAMTIPVRECDARAPRPF